MDTNTEIKEDQTSQEIQKPKKKIIPKIVYSGLTVVFIVIGAVLVYARGYGKGYNESTRARGYADGYDDGFKTGREFPYAKIPKDIDFDDEYYTYYNKEYLKLRLAPNFRSDIVAAKPVIYLYPEEETEVNVKVSLNSGEFTAVYPKFTDESSWKVKAEPDGNIVYNDKNYKYLYWESSTTVNDFYPRYCIKGEDTADFLEDTLTKYGLSEYEREDFITYWLPKMNKNKYNLITFDLAESPSELEVEPKADTMIRVFMQWQGSDDYIETVADEIVTPDRTGFTVVEWGGTELTQDN